LVEEIIQLDSSPYLIFIFAIRSPITREKYLQRIGYFFDYLGIEQGTIEERCNIFGQKAKNDINWLEDSKIIAANIVIIDAIAEEINAIAAVIIAISIPSKLAILSTLNVVVANSCILGSW
jgi:hypothetical protein